MTSDRIGLTIGGPTSQIGPWQVVLRLEAAPAAIHDLVSQPFLSRLWIAWFDADILGAKAGETPLILRNTAQGGKDAPIGTGRAIAERLQDVLVDVKVPRRLRDHLALLAQPDGEVLWVPGPRGRQSEIARITAETKKVLVVELRRAD